MVTYANVPDTAIPAASAPTLVTTKEHVSVTVPTPVQAYTAPPPPAVVTYAYVPDTAIPAGWKRLDAADVHVSVPVPTPVHACTLVAPQL